MHLFCADLTDPKARVGAILLADGLDCLRDLRGFVQGWAKGGRRRG